MINTLLKKRNSKRSFNDKKVSETDLMQILENASLTSSGGNIQPWKVKVVQNKEILNEISNKVSDHILNDGELLQDIQYYPTTWKKEYNLRRIETGKGFYTQAGINRRNKEEKINSWIDNFKWFGASTVLFIYVDNIFVNSSKGMLMDIGAFMQNILLTAEELGIDSCPQGAVGEYSKIIKPILNIDEEHSLLLSIVLGYSDNSVKNKYKPSRLTAEEFCEFIK